MINMKIESSNRLDRDGFSNNNRFGDIYDLENGPNIAKSSEAQSNQLVELGEVGAEVLETSDENLGEDFEVSRWLPPSIEKAVEFRKENVYRCPSCISLFVLFDYLLI